MEEPHPPIDSVEEYSAKTTEMLRSLRTQADEALESHRRKIGDIETELSQRIQQIAEELASDRTADEMEITASHAQREELSNIRKALHEAEAEIATQCGQLAALASDQKAKIVARDEQLQQLSEERDQLSQERMNLSEELGELLTEQLKSSEKLAKLVEQIGNLQKDVDQTSLERDQLTGKLKELGTQHRSLREERDQLADELEQLLTDAEESDLRHDKLSGELEELGTQRESLQGERDQLADELEQLLADAEENDRQREQLTGELEQLQGQHAQLAGERDQLGDELHQLQAQHEQVTSQRDQWGNELQTTRKALDEVREEKERQCNQLQKEHEQACQTLEQTRAASEELTNKLTKNEQLVVKLNETHNQQRTDHQRQIDEQKEHLEQSNRKCELALADVHKLKRSNAELHEELARRPETDDQDSPELVSLRAERDALAGRVEELESAPLPRLDEDSQQELSDLQRRFEMAVEDVRSLKQENASLHEQLEASPAAPVEASDSGDLGWEAQRARLLASLDAEDEGQATPQRHEERTTVEGTISITDQVVSEKDREIADLKAQLQARLAETESKAVAEIEIKATPEESLPSTHEELLSTDEIIQTERDRLEQLQHEWKNKLRTAELDISVQRATLAREQAKLEEKLALMESRAAELKGADGKPKHRWLSALGLDDKEDN